MSANRFGGRSVMLASTAVLLVMQAAPHAQAQTTEETNILLSRRSDTGSVVGVNLSVIETPSLFGLANDVKATGLDASFGNDRITILDGGSVSASVEEERFFSLLPDLIDVITPFLAPLTPRAEAVGMEGGFGANTLQSDGPLFVSASSKATLADFDVNVLGGLNDIAPGLDPQLDVTSTAIAQGIRSTFGATMGTNTGTLDVSANAEAYRTDVEFSAAGGDIASAILEAVAQSTALIGDRRSDKLINAVDAVITVKAAGKAQTLGFDIIGAKILDASDATKAVMIAQGMNGAGSNDILTNDGTINADAQAEVFELDVSLAVREYAPPSLDPSGSDDRSLASASAAAMVGGSGSDRITNTGALSLSAISTFDQTGIALTDGGISGDAIVTAFQLDEKEEVSDIEEGAVATITGIAGDGPDAVFGGADIISLGGTVNGTATAESTVVNISVGLPVSDAFDGSTPTLGATSAVGKGAVTTLLNGFGIGIMDYSSDAAAAAYGARGNDGNDVIINTASVDLDAVARAASTGVSVEIFDALPDAEDGDVELFSVNATVMNSAAHAVSTATGLSGDDNDDTLTNEASLILDAQAFATSTEVGVRAATEDKTLAINVPVIYSQTASLADAVGIDGGDGYDTISNAGTIETTSLARSVGTDVTLGISILNNAGGVNGVFADKTLTSTAQSTGIRDGQGRDTVDNSGTIISTATAETFSNTVGVTVGVNTTKGITLVGGFVNNTQSATARALGIERQLEDDPLDADASFTSTGDIETAATATSGRVSVRADLAYTDIGVTITAPIVESANTALAEAGVLRSFEADDVFTGLSDMTAAAAGTATSTTVNATAGISRIGVGAGISVMDISNTGEAQARLLDFGTGSDTVTNLNTLTADADADSDVVAVGVSVAGTMKGVAIAGSAIFAETKADAVAVGIDTGADGDSVVNGFSGSGDDEAVALIDADAFADADVTGVNVALSAIVGTTVDPGIGIGAAAALTFANIEGIAEATGVDLGSGADTLTNYGTIRAASRGKAKTETVDVSIGGSMIGAGVSGALADTSVTAKGFATGVQGGGGDDLIENAGLIDVMAQGDANTVGVSVGGSAAIGIAVGGSGLLMDTISFADARGMDGGLGMDTILDMGTTTVSAISDALNSAVAVNVTVNAGISANATYISSRTDADSFALGLAGDTQGLTDAALGTASRAEDDSIILAGAVDVSADASASAVSVNFTANVTLGLGLSGTIMETDTTANARSVGMFGGSGFDTLTVLEGARIDSAATASVSGPQIGVSLLGSNIGNINSAASAQASGVDGGAGNDTLRNDGTIFANANSTGSGAPIQFNVLGLNIGDMSTRTTADAYGLTGGLGDDMLMNTAEIDARATSTLTGAAVNIALVGAALSGTGASADAQAFGLFGDLGGDSLMSTGTITSNAASSVTGTSVAVNFVGASDADFGSTSTATAAGAAGGDGNNSFALSGTLDTTASANARATNVGVSLAGAAFSQSDTQATATSTGYLGGDDTDTGTLSATISATATATARNDAGSGNIAGAAFATTSPVATANAHGFAGAGGADTVVHTGTSTVDATANTSAGAYSVSLAGASSAKADPSANANAIGLDGGAGADMLRNTGTLTADANTDTSVGVYRVTVIGASIGSVSATTNAVAAGFHGQDGADMLINEGTLTADARSDIKSDGVDVTAIGAGVDTANGDIIGNAYATGIIGGGGGDGLLNTGSITSDANSFSDDGQVSVVIAGAGLSDAATSVTAAASGLDGEDGDDTIENSGSVTSDAFAEAEGTTTSVTIAGVAGGDANASTLATSWAIRGGDGVDMILSTGDILSNATARGRAMNVGVNIGGVITGTASSISTAAANGISGGGDDDTILNMSFMDLNASARGTVGRVNVGVVGASAGASVETDIQATSVAIAGDGGADTLTNDDALIDIDLTSSTTAGSTSVIIIGASNINSGLFSTATGTGLSGGSGDDALNNINGGEINILATANITASSTNVNIIGSSATRGAMRSRATAIGIDGGSEDDTVFSNGIINVNADANATTSGSTFTVAGAATSGGDVKSFATVTGVAGAGGNDTVSIFGTLNARSDARATFSSSNYSVAGYSGVGGAAGADAQAYGLNGGSGNDSLDFRGTGTVTADARLTTNSGVSVSFGATSSSRAPVGTTATAFGIAGFGDNDTISNGGILTVNTYSEVITNSTKFAFIGSASGNNSANARSLTYGLSGSTGNDTLTNTGTLRVRAEARSQGSGAAGTSIGSTSTASEFRATSNALVMSGGSGIDTLNNLGTLIGEVTNTTRSNNTVSSSALFSSGRARSTARNFGYGTLFLDTGGDTTINNSGSATLRYFGDRGSFRGLARTDSRSNGVTVGVDVTADARSYSFSEADLRGVNLSDGTHTVTNSGTINVINNAFSSAAATANGNALVSGFGYALADAQVSNTRVYGIESSTGALNLNNAGSIIANNSPRAATSASASATGVGLTDPDADTRTTITMRNNHAYAIFTGDAADVITNTAAGTITAISAPTADRALARSTPAGGVSLSVDADARAYAYVNDAEAYGIRAGHGDNQIFNAGVITVTSDPYAEARAEATGRGPDGDVEARSNAQALRAQAYGITAGAGNDFIENTGTITVRATPSADATNSVSPGEFCVVFCLSGEIDENSSPQSTSSTIAGIITGDGNDTVISAGTINASGGTAINLGDGNDTLVIAAANSFVGSVTAGSGSDTLELRVGGNFNASNMSFENFVKSDVSTSTLTDTEFLFIGFFPRIVNRLGAATTVTQGVLRTSSSAYFTNSSRLTTAIYADGTFGQLASGSLIFADGSLTVTAGEGLYVDGTTYDVVSWPSRSGTFDRITLPDATTLRSFSGRYEASSYRVTANVEPIAVALTTTSATTRSFAAALDGATTTARGFGRSRTARTLTALQASNDPGEIEAAVTALTPKLPTASLELATGTLSAGVEPVKLRLANSRAGLAGTPALNAVGFSYTQNTAEAGGFSQWGASFTPGNVAPALSSGLSSDTVGFVTGVDYMAQNGVMVGLATARLDGNGQLDDAFGAGSFNSMSASFYAAAPVGASGYANASVTLGQTRFDGSGSLMRFTGANGADSMQNSQAMRFDFETGQTLYTGNGHAEVYGGMSYQMLDGGGFSNVAAAGLDLNVQDGQSERVESRAGIRFVSDVALARSVSMKPSLDLAWVHRYGARADQVTASFADLPGYEFNLSGELENRDALAASAGLTLIGGKGYQLSASGRGEAGSARTLAAGEVRFNLNF